MRISFFDHSTDRMRETEPPMPGALKLFADFRTDA